MRLTLFLVILLLTGCAWFGRSETGNCLDDDSCEAASPEVNQTTGTWYCYGVSRDEPWNCTQTKDNSLIATVASPSPLPQNAPVRDIPDTQTPAAADREQDERPAEDTASDRAEITLDNEVITAAVEAKPQAAYFEEDPFFSYPESGFAVQLIALQSIEDVLGFADSYGIGSPIFYHIKSQGADWYVVLLGIYMNRTEADQAAEAWFNDNDPDSRPWVRPLGPLQRAVRNARSSSDS